MPTIIRENLMCDSLSNLLKKARQSWTIIPIIPSQSYEITLDDPQKSAIKGKKETEWTPFGLARETGYRLETTTSADLHTLSRPDNLIFSPWSGVRGCVTCARTLERSVNGFWIILSKTRKKEERRKKKNMCVICVCACACVRACVCVCVCVGGDTYGRERWIHVALVDREEANSLHYATTADRDQK